MKISGTKMDTRGVFRCCIDVLDRAAVEHPDKEYEIGDTINAGCCKRPWKLNNDYTWEIIDG